MCNLAKINQSTKFGKKCETEKVNRSKFKGVSKLLGKHHTHLCDGCQEEEPVVKSCRRLYDTCDTERDYKETFRE